MGSDHPFLLVLLIGASGLAFRWWWEDLRRAAPTPDSRALPGATPAPRAATALAVTGALLLLAGETVGENALGISGDQSRITVLFGLYTLAAAFLEEVIFRGYLVIEHRGRAALVAGMIGASLLFALLHPFLWRWDDGSLVLQGGTKAWFSTAVVFAGSLWFYFVRFMPGNPRHSLLPCIAAHAAKNLGVFVVKLLQGHVAGWW